MKKIQKKGISLIALVTTIVVLMIIVGVAIFIALKDDGIINLAKQAGNSYTGLQIKEQLELELLNMQTEKNSTLVLDDIKELKVTGYNVEVSETGKLITATSGNNTYAYWIDSNLKLSEFSQNIIVEDNNSTLDTDNSPINEYTPQITNVNGTYFTITATATSNDSNIVAYEYFVNDIYKGCTLTENSNSINVTNLELDTDYSIYVLALDDKGNMKKSNTITQRTLNRLYLYRRGDECSLVTGGWTNFKCNGGVGEKQIECLYMYCPIQNSMMTTYGFNTQNKINLGDYTKMKCIISPKMHSIGTGGIGIKLGVWDGDSYNTYSRNTF